MLRRVRKIFIWLGGSAALTVLVLALNDPDGALKGVSGLLEVPAEEFKGGLTTTRIEHPNGWAVTHRKDGTLSRIEKNLHGKTHGPLFLFSPLGHLKTATFNRDGNLLSIRNVGTDAPKWVVPFMKYSYYYSGPPPYGVLLTHLEKKVESERAKIAELINALQENPAARGIAKEKGRATELKAELISRLTSGVPDFSKDEFDVVVEPILGPNKLVLVHTLNVRLRSTRYLAAITVDLEEKGYPFTFHGPFTMGEILKSKAGKSIWPGQHLFVRFDTCAQTECPQPWTFAYAASLSPKNLGMPYIFIYGKSHEYYEPGLEINLPNEGLSSLGKVEARYVPHSDEPGAMTYLQEFRFGGFEKGKMFVEKDREYFTFRCRDFVCDYRMTRNHATPEFQALWEKATFLSKR